MAMFSRPIFVRLMFSGVKYTIYRDISRLAKVTMDAIASAYATLTRNYGGAGNDISVRMLTLQNLSLHCLCISACARACDQFFKRALAVRVLALSSQQCCLRKKTSQQVSVSVFRSRIIYIHDATTHMGVVKYNLQLRRYRQPRRKRAGHFLKELKFIDTFLERILKSFVSDWARWRVLEAGE